VVRTQCEPVAIGKLHARPLPCIRSKKRRRAFRPRILILRRRDLAHDAWGHASVWVCTAISLGKRSLTAGVRESWRSASVLNTSRRIAFSIVADRNLGATAFGRSFWPPDRLRQEERLPARRRGGARATRPQLAEAGVFHPVYLTPEQVQPGMIVKLSEILGRVLDHEKPAGYVVDAGRRRRMGNVHDRRFAPYEVTAWGRSAPNSRSEDRRPLIRFALASWRSSSTDRRR